MMGNEWNWIENELGELSEQALERTLTVHAAAMDRPGYTLRGSRVLLDLSSNDYLGLARHPDIAAAMSRALLAEGAGSGASRLVSGNRPLYGALERELADWQQCEAALVFANGYMANLGALQALAGRGDVVFSDRLNHASIVDGIALSRAGHARYRHNDMEHLQWLLNKYRDARRTYIVTAAVFSMDGDRAPLEELVRLRRDNGAMLMVDEAHSGGIFGDRGEGLCHALGLQNEIDVHMGTFSKSFGVYGAYICGSHTIIRWLLNKARPLIYSTALPPSVIAGIFEALTQVQAGHGRREQLAASNRFFRSALRKAGFQVGDGDSPIVPLVVHDNETALRFRIALEEEGIAAAAIRPPAVPVGTARIRFSLSAAHTIEELSDAVDRICQVGHRLEVLQP